MTALSNYWLSFKKGQFLADDMINSEEKQENG